MLATRKDAPPRSDRLGGGFALDRLSRRLAGALLVLAMCGAAPLAVAQQPSPPFITGVGTHFGQGYPDLTGSLDLAKQAGIQSIRDEVYWGGIERERGALAMPASYDQYVTEAVSVGIAPLLILDYGNGLYDGGDKPRSPEAIAAFTRYAAFVAQHFKGKVHLYEVWNEWDNTVGSKTPGSMEDYARLLKSVYPALKNIDPSITVLADAVVFGRGDDADLHKISKLGLLHFADGISIHPYQGTPEQTAARLQATEAALRRATGGKDVPLYATEIGWTSFDKGVGLGRQAAYAARLLLLLHSMSFVKGAWWYDLRNDGQDAGQAEQNFGLLWTDLTPKPAYYIFAAANKALSGASFLGRVDIGDGEDWLLRFSTPHAGNLWAFWTTKPDSVARFEVRSAAPVDVDLGEIGAATVRPTWTPDPNHRNRWHLAVTVGEMPMLLRGNLADASATLLENRKFPDHRR